MALTNEEQQQLDYLKQWVTARVDELMPNAQSPDVPIGLLDKELDEAARWVLLNARKELVYVAAKDGSDIILVQKPGKTLIPLDGKYLRFIRLQMQDWVRAIDSLIGVDSNVYRHQGNEFLRAGKERPTAAIVPYFDGDVRHAIECYPAAESVEQFIYIERLPAYKMPVGLVDAMVWLTASRTMQILGKGEQAQTAMGNMHGSLSKLLIGMHGEEIIEPEAKR